jgi:hypothetical protein
MPAQVGAITNEIDGLLGYLAQMRYVIKLTAYGLTPEQLRAAPTASELTVGGLIKHCASTEENGSPLSGLSRRPWTTTRTPPTSGWQTVSPSRTCSPGTTVWRNGPRRRWPRSGDLTHEIPIDHAVPWNRRDMDHWTLRWVLLHLIQETARHAGHADIIRESIDGATAYPLLAAAEGWPETEWLKPWKPAA